MYSKCKLSLVFQVANFYMQSQHFLYIYSGTMYVFVTSAVVWLHIIYRNLNPLCHTYFIQSNNLIIYFLKLNLHTFISQEQQCIKSCISRGEYEIG
jgi:hypothetical protein